MFCVQDMFGNIILLLPIIYLAIGRFILRNCLVLTTTPDVAASGASVIVEELSTVYTLVVVNMASVNM